MRPLLKVLLRWSAVVLVLAALVSMQFLLRSQHLEARPLNRSRSEFVSNLEVQEDQKNNKTLVKANNTPNVPLFRHPLPPPPPLPPPLSHPPPWFIHRWRSQQNQSRQASRVHTASKLLAALSELQPPNQVYSAWPLSNFSRVLLAVLSVNTDYHKPEWKTSHMEYAKRHGYAYLQIRRPLAPEAQAPFTAVNRLLAPLLYQEYEYVLILDQDIIISHNAPAIHLELTNSSQVGIVNVASQYPETVRQKRSVSQIISKDSKYEKCVNVTKSYNVGVMLFASNPVLRKYVSLLRWELQREIQRVVRHPLTHLEGILEGNSGIGVVEQYILSCALEHHDLAFDLDSAWNKLFSYEKHHSPGITVDVALKQTYFLHLAGKAYQSSGVRWLRIGSANTMQPSSGRRLNNSHLEDTLMRKRVFTPQEWAVFGIKDLRADDLIQSGHFYYMPVDQDVFALYLVRKTIPSARRAQKKRRRLFLLNLSKNGAD
jgi:hypothetical protein